MAQDITLLGAQYNDVPAVQLPKTGGGTARFDDASITTAVASDVTQGKVFLAADGTITTGTMSGGAVIIQDTTDSHGGTIREITATDVVNLQSGKTVTPSTSSQTVTPDTGYDAFESVTVSAMPSGTAGTPTATKGSVSNHAVSVTPSVTNTTGYITGGTKTGTAVTVSASELVSGSQTITQNDTYNVTNLASVTVNVPTSGGTDTPKFTVVWDSNWENILSVSCDKTYQECMDMFFNDGINIAEIENTDQGQTETYKSFCNVVGTGVNDEIEYTAVGGVEPLYDLQYASTGVITATQPSVYNTSLNITTNGTYYPYAFVNEVNVNVSGGGGASNVVTGTFTGTTTGVAMDVALNYTGTGYPIAVVIFPIEGSYNTSSSFYSLLQRYVISQYVMTKINNTAPTYSTSGDNNGGTVQLYYKNSTSDITNYGRSGSTNQNIYSGTNSSSTNNLLTVRFKSATTMSVFIASTSSYGFAANYEYKYCIMYSS